MFVKQLYTGCLSEAAYYIESNGEAAIIDPLRDIDSYLELANERKTRINYIFETHFHADFVSGHIDLAMEGGSVSDLMVSLAGLQIVDALVLYVTGDRRIPIRCALGRLDFNRGAVTFDRTVLDTQKSVLHVEGGVELKSQMVNVVVNAQPKKFDLLDLHGPVTVQGKIRKPAITIKVPIPHPVIGDAKDIACEALTEQLLSGKP